MSTRKIQPQSSRVDTEDAASNYINDFVNIALGIGFHALNGNSLW